MACPHCGTALRPHDAEYGAKRGALHCDACGCCFLADGVTPREGVPLCVIAAESQAPVEETASVEPEPVAASEPADEVIEAKPDAETEQEPRRGRARHG